MFNMYAGPHTFRVQFVHFHPNEYPVGAGTNCYVYDTQGNIVATGDSWLSEGDNFSRAMGRKVAFTRALRDLGLTYPLGKTERSEAWDSYWLKHNPPKRGR